MSARRIGFGLVGAGLAAETHARELRAVEAASLVAVYARNREKAERLSSAAGACAAYDDFERFLADPRIEAVIVATPNGLHRDFALAAAAAGKHLVVEKPLEITTDRGRDIIEACTRHGVRLFVVYQMRFSAAACRVRHDIATGRLGKIVLVNVVDNEYRTAAYYAQDAWRGTRSIEGGGCLITQTSHLLDLVQYLVGPVSNVFAFTATALHAIETEDTAVAALRFQGGALGTVSSSTAAYPAHRHLVSIVGTEGSIVMNGEHDQIVFRASRHDDELIDVPSDFSFADPQDPRLFPTNGQRRQLASIAHALLRGPSSEAADDPLGAVRLLDAIYRSAEEGRMVATAEFGPPMR